jgi:TatD DNase family protein
MLTSARGRALVAAMPRNRVLTETDGPFLEHGGRQVQPWEVSTAEEALAGVWAIPHEDIAIQLSNNLSQLLGGL